MQHISVNNTLINPSWDVTNHVNINEKEPENEYQVYTYIPKENEICSPPTAPQTFSLFDMGFSCLLKTRIWK